MQKITTFLTFDSQAEEAATLYVSIFKGAKIVSVAHYGDNQPMPKGTVLTAEIEIAGQRFVMLNAGKGFKGKFTDAVSLSVDCADQAEVDDVWEKLIAGGGEPVACGWLHDRFGVSWQIVPRILPELLRDKDPARVNRVMQAMMKMVKLDVAALKRAAE
jgi:predicted 3-demethylubiquinone-9 3-methyltransferase (glyoxalase superfamily)